MRGKDKVIAAGVIAETQFEDWLENFSQVAHAWNRSKSLAGAGPQVMDLAAQLYADRLPKNLPTKDLETGVEITAGRFARVMRAALGLPPINKKTPPKKKH